ncbi:restriction endonuclease [Streptacidiphilus sp. P02-A3a]|uniref:restriction endonuclease n=1 Tax=Streptacidiphilus sp. P02-A3a TaxID=2704468 RepID=UPI0015FD3875|nr:restriction endonuclease [Streptacidiphilus sp. P02-A3a]QMU68469.1 restriction endonuclease [Streptacidiphilus sp. P02-A3a]
MGRLTDLDFETVCQDPFSDLLGCRLEILPRGRDQGIDLRHAAADGTTTVGECKDWPRAISADVLNHLIKVELAKVQQPCPARYFIATSAPLTVDDR